MKTYITRTVSYYNDETDNIERDFEKEYPTAVIEILEDVSISGIIVKEFLEEFETVDECIDYCSNLECLIGECFTVYDAKGKILFDETFEPIQLN